MRQNETTQKCQNMKNSIKKFFHVFLLIFLKLKTFDQFNFYRTILMTKLIELKKSM